ncbi:MBL fold metallo-hydrolase [Youngiibacter multivorans]|uniref:Glyoxylase-like metal-dependent hydrolase (Beta-lactamase superfamily II) n=1 Tax=Youngiibacter multivorans TaxID=937251 RepID=A0ABS4G264_9CLOT|nr:MBL fold metallo-hydrolase [Youngiibacter multivorans]MBP1918616.1 glyoxylase-like metal-dependent hydrolase (beta-lactamase superfamily II) [Youngiibacter multivorans]
MASYTRHANIIHILGDTYVVDTGDQYIPFYDLGTGNVVLIDSGYNEDRDIIEAALLSRGFKVAGIACSHSHVDHTGNNAYFREKYGCIIAMPELDAILTTNLLNLKFMNPYLSMTDINERFSHLICKTDIKVPPEDTTVDICGKKFRFIPTLGHTTSHMSIVTPDDVIYLGDAIISIEVLSGLKLPYMYSVPDYLETLKVIQNFSFKKYIISHRGSSDEIYNIAKKNIEGCMARIEIIYNLIDKPMTMEDIFKAAVNEFYINVGTIKKHLVIERMFKPYADYLFETGRLRRILENGFLKYMKA